MSSISSKHFSDTDKEMIRRERHADAQARYRERYLLETCAKARVRMQRHRAAVKRSPQAAAAAAERRQVTDADYRFARSELDSSNATPSLTNYLNSKFIEKFGQRAFIRTYLPLHDTLGPYILGKKFLWESEPVRRRKSKKKSKEAGAQS
ncbi:hypothetical protein C8F04DRAFT_1187280 [Mycena alexandri]|uniref:Uncharacterized protein n=1 Tax=Mycena alexandri TaxID=1745969 RepID=A0AAD6SMJ9_9AGAR|nr:hypothetical protein C8F04DRAFT_1187280 [Mycena alexandri]